LFAVSSCQRTDQRISALVLAVEGEAHGSFHERIFALTKGSQLQPGTVVEVSPRSRLDLMLLPGIRVELTGPSRAEIGPLRLERDGDETIEPMTAREATLDFSGGTFLGSVGRVQTRSRLRVAMPLGSLSAGSGRLCTVVATEKNARIASFRGKLNFVPANSTAPITIDAKSAVDCSKSALRASSVTAEETVAATRRERELLQLERQKPPPFIPWGATSPP